MNHEDTKPLLKPIDTFDPTDDGWGSMTLAEVIDIGEAALAAVKALHLALHACRTPLNLKPTTRSLAGAQDDLASAVSELSDVRQIIESDVPLAIRYPGKEPWVEETGAVLSPRQILSLARRGRSVQPLGQTTYRAVLEE